MATICYDFKDGGGRRLLANEEGDLGGRATDILTALADKVVVGINSLVMQSHGARSLAAAPAPKANPGGGPNGTTTTDYMPYYGAANCPPGQEQLWSPKLQHETHLFLFAIAITHITYSTLTLVLSKLIVRGASVSHWRPHLL